MTYFQENGQIEPKSPKGNWSAIHEKAPFSKKKIKLGPWRSKVFRHSGETGKKENMSQAALDRKAKSQIKIQGYQNAQTRYRILAANPMAKVNLAKSGEAFIQPRLEKGKFGPRIVIPTLG